MQPFDDHLRRRTDAQRDREWDAYTADLRRVSGLETAQELIPPGVATCVDCGRRDLLSVSTPDGRRIVLEAASDGDGDMGVADDFAKPRVGGDFVIHNCRHSKPRK